MKGVRDSAEEERILSLSLSLRARVYSLCLARQTERKIDR